MSENFVEKKDGAKDKQRAELSKLLGDKLQELNSLSNTTPLVRARMQLDAAELLVALERKLEAWILAREAFDSALQHDAWKNAMCCTNASKLIPSRRWAWACGWR